MNAATKPGSVRMWTFSTRKRALAQMEQQADRFRRMGFTLRMERVVRREWAGGPEKVKWDIMADPIRTA